MMDLYYLSQADGAGDWREKEAKDLSSLVQNRITYLQVHQEPCPPQTTTEESLSMMAGAFLSSQ